MVFILFSAFGSDFLATDFVERHKLENFSVWSKGQPLRSGRLHKDAGLSVSLEDAQTTVQVIPRIESFLKENQYWLAALDQQPVERLIHLGVTVGEDSSFAPCLEFDFAFLRLLVQHNISLHVSSYPTSDAEEPPQETVGRIPREG